MSGIRFCLVLWEVFRVGRVSDRDDESFTLHMNA